MIRSLPLIYMPCLTTHIFGTYCRYAKQQLLGMHVQLYKQLSSCKEKSKKLPLSISTGLISSKANFKNTVQLSKMALRYEKAGICHMIGTSTILYAAIGAIPALPNFPIVAIVYLKRYIQNTHLFKEQNLPTLLDENPF